LKDVNLIPSEEVPGGVLEWIYSPAKLMLSPTLRSALPSSERACITWFI